MTEPTPEQRAQIKAIINAGRQTYTVYDEHYVRIGWIRVEPRRAAILLRAVAGVLREHGEASTAGACEEMARALAPQRFLTEDGFDLVLGSTGWTNGDILFDLGEDGLPIDYETKEPLSGRLLGPNE